MTDLNCPSINRISPSLVNTRYKMRAKLNCSTGSRLPTQQRHDMQPTKTLLRCHHSNQSLLLLFIYIITIITISIMSLIVPVTLATSRPTFIRDMNMHTIKENTRIGEEIYTLLAQDPDGAKVLYGIEETNLFGVDKYTGRVRVINNIDFETTGANLRLVVTATSVPTPQQIQQKIQPPTVKMSIDVNILDENDNTPKISQIRLNKNSSLIDTSSLLRKPFKLNVSEDIQPNTILIEQIQANDKDTIGETPLTAICMQCEPEFELFESSEEKVSSQSIVVALRTKSQLSYIPKNNIRSLTLLVTDGKFNSSLNVEINILDKQNKPPNFIGSVSAIVPENAPIDTKIMTIKAIDGDATGDLSYQIDTEHQRQVVYTMKDHVDFPGASKYFRLDHITGDLVVANRLDREEFFSSGGVITFIVKATEVISNQRPATMIDFANGQVANILDPDDSASSETLIKVLLTDVNDNSPQWLNNSDVNRSERNNFFNSAYLDTGRIYEVNIEENSPPGTPLGLLDMYVQDIDSGINNQFKIELIDSSGKFDVEPKSASGYTSVSLRVAKQESGNSATLLDYENLNERKFVLQVVATETFTKEQFSSTATVRVNVININDNPPEFREQFYRGNVREDAPKGRSILSITATDKDMSEIHYSLIGHTAHLFDINPITGLVTVAQCDRNVVGIIGCIDYETQKQHHILVQATDGQLNAVVPLTIYVEDASDNPPIMLRDTYEAVIEEGFERFEPPLKVEAIDDDLTSIITYSIIEGNFEGLFTINNSTGEIQLTRKIKLSNNGESPLKLIVQATDGLYYSNATIKIDVLDSNDNAPKFPRDIYQLEIPLNRPEKRNILRLTAHDTDKGLNAKLSYKIQRGSFGMFAIDENSGDLSIEDGVKFDLDKKSEYHLEVIAFDHGLISKSGTANVYVKLRDINNKPPQFTPNIQKAEIFENVPPRTVIHRLQVSESVLETGVKLQFQSELIEARDKNGNAVVDIDSLRQKLSVDMSTGDVIAYEKLDHDQVAYINMTVSLKEDSLYALNSKSYGYLLISVKDYNDNPPSFAAPWSLLKPELHFTMNEEKSIGSALAQLVASDIDSKISYFKIDAPNDYFELSSPQSGTIVNKRVIDYDTLMTNSYDAQSDGVTVLGNILHFNVSVFDSGVPLLSAQARIYVEILPINDCDCKFNQSFYTATVKENSPEGTFVVQTRAHDNDWGQHGRLLYCLHENNDQFKLDPSTGTLRVGSGGLTASNREKVQSTLTMHVIATDNQRDPGKCEEIDPSESRTCSAPIKITIEDINDNPPQFSQKFYEFKAYDGDSSIAPIAKLSIKDLDSKIPAFASSKRMANQYSFRIISGNINEMFNITDQGLIFSIKSLNSTSLTEFRLKIVVSQHHSSILSDECEVTIKVTPMNRHSPEFILPANGQAFVNESGPTDLFVTQVKCKDDDYGLPSDDYSIRYSFKVNALDVQETDQFIIDSKTGNITTKVSLDRETKSYYQLIVACNDNGLPQALETLSLINVHVLDIDDNKPEFLLSTHQLQQNKLRQLQYKTLNAGGQFKSNFAAPLVVEFQVDEKQGRNMIVGEIKAIDQDQISGPMRYCIIDGNEFQEFYIDRDTGIIYANQTLDREKQSFHDLTIKAVNDGLSCEEHINNLSIKSSASANPINSFNQFNQLTQKTNYANFGPNSIHGFKDNSMIKVRIQVNDVNDNKPIFKKSHYKVGVRHRALVNTSVTQIVAFDPDNGINASVSYTISGVSLYKRQNLGNNNNNHYGLQLKQRLVQSPFRIDKNGYVYTTQLLTQYPLASMFSINIEAQERVPPQRIATTKLDIWTYETYHQVRIKVNMRVKTIEQRRDEIEDVMSNITKCSAIINDIKSYYDTSRWIINSHNAGKVVVGDDHGHVESANGHLNYLNHKLTFSKFNGNLLGSSNDDPEEATASNLYLIFVDDNNRLINPQTVIERFDVSSAHLFKSQDDKETDPNNNQRGTYFSMPVPEPFIDNIALASSQLESLQQYSILSNEILDVPTLFVIVTAFLTFIGSIMMCIGCCCMKNWYRDHLVRNATKKLIKQHAVQAKINEQMLAAAAIVQQQQDIMSASSANMASLDAINCTNNNNENISIIRAMNANNTSTLQGIVNQGAHLYDNPNNALIDDTGHNNGMTTIRGGLTNAQRRQQLPNDDPLNQKIQPTSWEEEKMAANNDNQRKRDKLHFEALLEESTDHVSS